VIAAQDILRTVDQDFKYLDNQPSTVFGQVDNVSQDDMKCINIERENVKQNVSSCLSIKDGIEPSDESKVTVVTREEVKFQKFVDPAIQDLYGFADATWFGCNSRKFRENLHQGNEEKRISFHLFRAKARAAPSMITTVSRLEFKAITHLNKLARQEQVFAAHEFVYNSFKIKLGYVASETWTSHAYVSNENQQVKNHTNMLQLTHVSTKDNLAQLQPGELTFEKHQQSTLLYRPKCLCSTTEQLSSSTRLASYESMTDYAMKSRYNDTLQLKGLAIAKFVEWFTGFTMFHSTLYVCKVILGKILRRYKQDMAGD